MLIFLTGFMCAGKTTDGRATADLLQIPLLDLDAELEHRSGLLISTFIETQGIDAFRRLESDILLNTEQLLTTQITSPSSLPQAIIATGGGCVLRPENRSYLSQPNHLTIWLNLPFELLYDRLSLTSRPLLQDLTKDEIYRIYAERLPYYRMSANLEITTQPIPEQIAALFPQQS